MLVVVVVVVVVFMDQINNNNEIKVKLRTTNCDDLAALKAENMGRKCGFKLIRSDKYYHSSTVILLRLLFVLYRPGVLFC